MIPNSILKFAQRIDNFYLGNAYLVGGWVRDHVLGIENKDYDIEVHGVPIPVLKEFISKYYDSDIVGESYKVWKVYMTDDNGDRITVDVSVPRTEKRVGEGHKAFEVTGDPLLPIEDACRRRDFTMNAMLYHILDNRLVDPYNGQHDIKNNVIRVVDPETFVEDSLRVLRAMQFAARFNFSIDADTIKLCQSIDLSDLPAERLWGEIEKWFLSRHPSVGMKYFLELGIYKLFPVDNLLSEDPELFSRISGHIGDAMDFFLTCKGRPSKNGYKQALFICFLSNLFYTAADLEKFLNILKVYSVDGYDVRKKVMQIAMHSDTPLANTQIRRESTKKDLELFFDFKMCETVVLKGTVKALVMAEDRARALNCLDKPLQPLLMGKHVLELGVPEGKKVGEICKSVFEMQIAGKINTVDEAVEAARRFV